jgi:Domain of unknown function (DUF4136)
MMRLAPTRALLIPLLLLLVAACASTPAPQAVIDHDPNFNFSAVRGIYLQPFSRTNPATISISDMQVERINASIEQELRSKGFAIVADSRQADLLLSWYLVTEENITLRTYDSPRYANTGIGNDYTKGTLVVDMTDPMRNKAVWRGIFQSRLKAQPDPQQSDAIRRTAVAAIFSSFPPPPASGATR